MTRRLRPSFVDVDLHDTLYWWNARISRFSTLENRGNSQQPPQEVMTIPALTLGIAENLAEMETTLQQCGYTWNELANSRESTSRCIHPLAFAVTAGKELRPKSGAGIVKLT